MSTRNSRRGVSWWKAALLELAGMAVLLSLVFAGTGEPLTGKRSPSPTTATSASDGLNLSPLNEDAAQWLSSTAGPAIPWNDEEQQRRTFVAGRLDRAASQLRAAALGHWRQLANAVGS